MEAIAYAVPGVKEHFKTRFKSQENFWFHIPDLDRLKPQKYSHYALGPIMENEGTLAGTYGVLKNIFGGDDGDCGFQEGQLGYKESSFDDSQIVFINGDEKTVSLLQSAQRERRFERRTDAQLQWFIPVPGLFHWRMNYINMVHDIFDGPESAEDSLKHSKINLGAHRSSKTKFHHKEEVAIKTFYARVFAYFASQLPKEYIQRAPNEILTPDYALKWIKGDDITTTRNNKEEEGWLRFLALVEAIQKTLFEGPERGKTQGDEVFRNHVWFIQDMALYLTFKFAIKHADIGLIERVIIRCCLIFAGSGKPRYTQQALYLTRLLATDAAHPVLKRALLASMLVNCRGRADSWFKTDRLNEHHNLLLKLLLQSRAHSSVNVTELFRKVSLTASYCLDLREAMEHTFGKVNSTHHTMADAADDVFKLSEKLRKKIAKVDETRKSRLLNYRDTITVGNHKLTGYTKISLPQQAVRPKPNSITESSQTPPLSPFSKAAKKLKKDSHWPDLIKAFNARLRGRAVLVEGLDDKAVETTTPIERLTERATINDDSDDN